MPDDAPTQRRRSRRFTGNTDLVRTDDLDFDLPPELIAQAPLPNRSDSRLLHYSRSSRSIQHRAFADLVEILHPSDVLVLNDARVMPARFVLCKATGGRIEGLFLSEPAVGQWVAMLRNLGDAGAGAVLVFESAPELQATILANHGEGEFLLGISQPLAATEILRRIGRMPLPPYIKRDRQFDPRDETDRSRYQTVYAVAPGAIAAPTAGLHFTPELLQRFDEAGIERIMLTLHVGVGTFKPISVDSLDQHVMHEEAYSINEAAAEGLNRAKRDGRRLITVGTTSARVLESQPPDEPFAAREGRTSLFVYPPYQWKHVGGLITNFHLPRSTLIALVAAMTGLGEQRRMYQEAIERRYRFFSYGDAMFID
jgi:S-adenosylmethionine:tRNA ribosyltransferase-isomerase